jgi:hypothetical protein
MFAKVISIGYASVASTMKMYPRNVWVREAVKGKKYVNLSNGEIDSYTLDELKVSAQNGINVKPILSYNSSTHTITATNAGEVELAAGQQLGLVVVCYYASELLVKVLYTGMGSATTGITVPASVYGLGAPVDFVGFFKVIEATGNDIATDAIPWKYPSATSVTSDKEVIGD